MQQVLPAIAQVTKSRPREVRTLSYLAAGAEPGFTQVLWPIPVQCPPESPGGGAVLCDITKMSDYIGLGIFTGFGSSYRISAGILVWKRHIRKAF